MDRSILDLEFDLFLEVKLQFLLYAYIFPLQ